jgi:type VI secretion system secreted protein VgrG
VRGREAISELYRFDVTLVSTECLASEPAIDPDDIVGASATLSFVDRHGAHVRHVSGIIESARLLADATGYQHAVYEVSIVPRAHLLSLVTRDEIFLDQSVLEIIQNKLDRLELFADSYVEMRLFNDYWRRERPELRATSGYGPDGQRFFREIEPELARRSVARETVVRSR